MSEPIPTVSRGIRLFRRPARHARDAAGRGRRSPLRPFATLGTLQAPRSAIHNPQSTLRHAQCNAIHNPRFDTLSATQSEISPVSAGFTLLEAIVALTIFSAGALTLYGLFNTNLVSLQRVHDVTSHLPAAQRAVTHLSAIDPRHRPEGRIEFDDYAVVWSARLLEPVRQGQHSSGWMGHYEIGLYRIDFTLSEHGRPVGRYRLRLTGYEKVRGSRAPLDESGLSPF